MKVCFGGTFDPIHKGHKKIIDKSFKIGTEIFIGLTSDKMAQVTRNLQVTPFEKRKKGLEDYILKKNFKAKYHIVSLDNQFGSSVERDFDVMIVSPETKEVANKVNDSRKKNSLKTLKIIIVPYVKAEDGIPISSTRIKNREIDSDGNLLTKL